MENQNVRVDRHLEIDSYVYTVYLMTPDGIEFSTRSLSEAELPAAEAHAHRLAAAPDLLRACEALLACISEGWIKEHELLGDHEPIGCAYCLREAAIKKGQGPLNRMACR